MLPFCSLNCYNSCTKKILYWKDDLMHVLLVYVEVEREFSTCDFCFETVLGLDI